MNIIVWNEYRHEKKNPSLRIFTQKASTVIAQFLKAEAHTVKTATLDELEHGLAEEVLNSTDVLIWWGHIAHEEVNDEIV